MQDEKEIDFQCKEIPKDVEETLNKMYEEKYAKYNKTSKEVITNE